MSKLGNRFTKKSVNWQVDTKDAPYVKAKDLNDGKTHILHGCFLTPDNGYGVGGVLITENEDEEIILVNTPASTVEDIRVILEDKELQESILAGNEFFKVRPYMNTKLKKAKECYAIDFCDCE